MPRQMPSTGCVSVGIDVDEPGGREPLHAGRRGADAGQDHVARGANARRVLRQRHVGAEPLERELQRREIRAARRR